MSRENEKQTKPPNPSSAEPCLRNVVRGMGKARPVPPNVQRQL